MEDFQRADAYWLSPHGESIPVDTAHIREVIANPDRFGLDRAEVRQMFKDFNEPLGLEGKARSAIMTRLIEHGWIRVRLKPKSDLWIFDLWDIRRSRDVLLDFLVDAVHFGYMHKNADLRISELKDGLRSLTGTPTDFSSDHMIMSGTLDTVFHKLHKIVSLIDC